MCVLVPTTEPAKNVMFSKTYNPLVPINTIFFQLFLTTLLNRTGLTAFQVTAYLMTLSITDDL
jgi:hypothetical protein